MNDSAREDVSDWVVAAQSGSSEAFRKLHRRFVALVHGVLLSRFRPTIAEELTQECFLLAFQKLRQLREPSKFGSWIVAGEFRGRAARAQCRLSTTQYLLKYSGKKGRIVTQALSRSGVMYSPTKAARHENSMR